MKNVVKKLFSLLLVGVVAVSMFSFVAPPAEAAEAAEAGSNGTLIINQRGGYVAGFHVTFYSSFGGKLGEYDTGYLAKKNTREFKIPKNTYRVHVYVSIVTIFKSKKEKNIDFYADESVVNEKSRIELTSTNVTANPKFDVKFNNGWSEKKPEYSHEESIQFTSYFIADNPNMYFKATFYREDCQIGEKSVKLLTSDELLAQERRLSYSETIKIPYATTSIKVEVIKEGTPIDSDTLKYNPAKKSKDDITINLGIGYGRWDSMKINCPNSWKDPEPAEADSNGTLIINQRGGYVAGFHVTFYDSGEEILGEYDTGYLAICKTRDFEIPKNTYRVHVHMAIAGGNEKDIDFYADELIVNEGSRIELTSKGALGSSRFKVKFNYGWSDKGLGIHFTSYFNADNPNMYFKATFYGKDYKIGEKSVKLSNIGKYRHETVVDSATIKIPKGTTSIKVEIIKEGTPIDSATLKCISTKGLEDDITITLGSAWYGDWKAMEFNCPESWQRIYE